jgi:hypothetical protein
LCELKEFLVGYYIVPCSKQIKRISVCSFDSDYTRRDNFYFMMVKKGFEILPPDLRFDNPYDSEQHRQIPLL